MWQDLMLAGTGGSLTALTVWWILGLRLTQQSQGGGLSRRLKEIQEGPKSAPEQPSVVLTNRQERYSSLPALSEWLSSVAAGKAVLVFLEQAGSSLSVEKFLFLPVVCGAAAAIGVALLHVPSIAGLLFVLTAIFSPFLYMSIKRRKRFTKITEQLPDAIRLMFSAMRAGLGMESGMTIVTQELPDPLRGEFYKVMNDWRLYGNMNEAFVNLARRVPSPDIRLFVSAACLHREVGGNFVEVLEQLESTIRNRFQLYRELKTLTAESRVSGWVLGGLPILVGLIIFSLNHDYMEILFKDPKGKIALWVAVALQLIGFMVIRWLTHPKIR